MACSLAREAAGLQKPKESAGSSALKAASPRNDRTPDTGMTTAAFGKPHGESYFLVCELLRRMKNCHLFTFAGTATSKNPTIISSYV